MALFLALTAKIAWKASQYAPHHPWLILASMLAGWISADFVSGLVHWAGDTWGTVEWPILGKALIRPFREHHVDPLAMTRHDLVESSGSHCLISLPVLLAVDQVTLQSVLGLGITLWLCTMTFFVFLTATIHKWAHQERVGFGIRVLQRLHLVLPREHHAVHHCPPYQRYYCITTGWLNPVLTRLRVFPMLETLITWLTGAIPRQDDLGLRSPLQASPDPNDRDLRATSRS
jgi:plasmanylethanolamine desaturase